MFSHLYKYKLKSLFREKENFFWIMFFPIILGTFFFLAFANVTSKSENFKTVDVAIVIEDEANSSVFKMMMDSLSESSEEKKAMFNPSYVSEDEANKLLSDKKVTGIIIFKDGTPALKISQNGINETIIKSVLDSYLQTAKVIESANGDVQKINETMAIMHGEVSSVIERKLTNGNMDNMADYFYALIAMACMFATLSGLDCANSLNANLSAVGMRKSLSSRKKLSLILSDSAATLTLHLISNAVLIVYLKYIIKVNLGGNFFNIYLVACVGSLIGICIGILIGSIHKLSLGAKIGINISISLVSSFFSGLMVGGIKQSIEKACPILNRINPSTLISDALYALNIYDDYRVYTERLLIMVGMSLVLLLISFLITRREKYDSI